MNAEPLALPHTDWLRHTLAVSGPAADMQAFQAAAKGTGAIPWALDLDHEEARLLAPMAAAGADARALARELREAIDQARILAQAAQGGACPFDLHRLVPVPGRILQLGPDDPASRLWLWTRWGTLQPLRHVRMLDRHADRRLRRSARVVLEFYAADWTPWRALAQIRAAWPSLVFDVQPDYGDG